MLQPESLVLAKKKLHELLKDISKLPVKERIIVAHHQEMFFSELCRPFTEYKNVSAVKKGNSAHAKMFAVFNPRVKVIKKFSLVTFVYRHIVLAWLQILFTLLSCVLSLVMKRSSMIHMGDFVHETHFWDFRLAGIFKELEAKGKKAHVFVRSFEKPHILIKNYFLRLKKGYLCFYIDPFKNYIGALDFITKKKITGKTPFERMMQLYFPRGTKTVELQIRFIQRVYSCLGIRSCFIGSATSRIIPELLACRFGKTKAIGIIHGAPIPNFNVWEYFDVVPRFKGLCSYEKYGVWSKAMREYLLNTSHYFTADILEESGYLIQHKVSKANMNKYPTKPKVLWVCEPSVDPAQVIDHIRALLDADYTVGLSRRPMLEDKFWVGIRDNYPDIFSKVITEKGSIFDNAPKYDVTVGVASTAVLDALLCGRRCLFVNTPKWGDTFEIQSFHNLPQLFSSSPKQTVENIASLGKVPLKTWNYLKDFYYNPKLDGGKWVAHQLINLAK